MELKIRQYVTLKHVHVQCTMWLSMRYILKCMKDVPPRKDTRRKTPVHKQTKKNQLKCELHVTPPPLVVLRRVPCVDLVSTFGRSRGRSHAMFIYGILVVYHSDIHGSFRSACTAHLPSF